MICLLALSLGKTKAATIFSDGFETPSVSGFNGSVFSPGWTLSEPSDPSQLGLASGGFAYEGLQVAQINANNTPAGASFSRSLATNIGQVYNLSLRYYSYVGVDAAVQANFGSSSLSSLTLGTPVVNTWYELTLSATATSTSTLLTITDVTTNTSSSDLFLDAITVASVPEPSMLGLFGLGTSAMLLRRNRKKQI